MTALEAYRWRVGYWSRSVGDEFVAWLALPGGLRWLDVGCGEGALTGAVLRNAAVDRVTGVDPSFDALAAASKAIDDPRVSFHQARAEALPFARDSHDVLVSALVLNFVEDLEAAMREMTRVVVASGRIAAYLWDFAGEMQVLRRFWDAAMRIDPGASAWDHGRLYPLCQPQPLRQRFSSAGLVDVEVTPIVVEAVYPGFDIYWNAMRSGDATPGRYLDSVSDSAREAIRQELLARLPITADGSFALAVRAWAARGTVAGH